MNNPKGLTVLNDIEAFYNSPNLEKIKLSLYQNCILITQLVCLSISITLLLNFLTTPLRDFILEQNGIILNSSAGSLNIQIVSFLTGNFSVAIREELEYRLMFSNSRILQMVGVGLLCFLAYRTLSFFSSDWTYNAICILGLIISIYFLVGVISNKRWLQDHLKSSILISSFYFGMIHVLNFYFLIDQFTFLLPFLFISIIMHGYLFTFARIKFGFPQACIYHALYNMLFMIFINLQSIFEVTISSDPFNIFNGVFIFLALSIILILISMILKYQKST